MTAIPTEEQTLEYFAELLTFANVATYEQFVGRLLQLTSVEVVHVTVAAIYNQLGILKGMAQVDGSDVGDIIADVVARLWARHYRDIS